MRGDSSKEKGPEEARPEARETKEEERRRTILFLAVVSVVFLVFAFLFHLLLGGSVNCENVLPTAKDGCYLNKAKETGDITLCEKIESNFTRDLCLENFRGIVNFDYCNRYSGDLMRDTCFGELAYSSGNYTYCGYISRVDRRDDCYYNLALNLSDPTICERSSESRRLYCANAVHTSVALERNDPSECQRLQGTDLNSTLFMIDSCLLQLGMTNNNTAACDLIRDPMMKVRCMRPSFGEELCEGYTDRNARDVCYLSVAVQSNNSMTCMKIASSTWRDNCLMNIAQALHDKGICDTITSSNMREVCRQAVR